MILDVYLVIGTSEICSDQPPMSCRKWMNSKSPAGERFSLRPNILEILGVRVVSDYELFA